MMRRNAYLLSCLAATVVTVSGCSPFHTKLHRPASHEVADPVALTEAEPSAGRGFQLPSLSLPAAKKPKMDDQQVQQLTSIARLAERRDQGDQAEKAYHHLISNVPDNPLAFHRLGVMKARQSKFGEAERLLSKAYQLNPTDPQLLSDIGYLYYLTSDKEKAEEFYRYALRFDSSHKACCNNLGILLGEDGRYDEAEAFFRRGCKDAAEVETNMAFVYSQRGELSRAMDAYSRALTIDNTLKPAAHGLLNLARKKDRSDSASDRSTSAPEQAEVRRPEVADIVSVARRRAARGRARQDFTPAVITYGNDVTADGSIAEASPPTSQPASKGILATLSNFAGSLTSQSDRRPASDGNSDMQTSARVDDESPTRVEGAQRQTAVRALFTAPGDDTAWADNKQPSGGSGVLDGTDLTPKQTGPADGDAEVAPPEPQYAAAERAAATTGGPVETPPLRGFLAPKAMGVQRRLMDLRTEDNSSVAAPAQSVTQRPIAPPEKLADMPSTKPGLSAKGVSVNISDFSNKPANPPRQQGNGENANEARSSSRRVSPASYAPSNQDGHEEGIRQMFSATKAEHHDASQVDSEAVRAAGTDPNGNEAVQDFLDNWLDPPQARISHGSPHSSRRVVR